MDNNLVEKSNILNNFKCKPKETMTLNELRFFCMFVSKLNPLERELRTVNIKLSEFEEIFNVKINTTEFNQILSNVISRNMYIYEKNKKKHSLINLYSKFEWCDGFENDIITISANYDIVPYLWDLKSNYTSYKLGNIAKLKSVSRIRLYEILAQYKKIGSFEIEIDDLKELLQSKQKEFKDFNKFILIPAIKDINEYTDLMVSYEKVLKCRKCVALKFFIEDKPEKENFVKTEKQEVKQISVVENPKTLEDLYKKYFNSEQKEHFKENIKIALQDIYKSEAIIKERTEVIYKQCVNNFKINSQTTDINSPLAYMQGIINNIIKEEIKNPKKEKRRSYDINQFEKFAINYPELQKVENGEVSESHFEPVLEPVKETKVICQEEVEKPLIEPVKAENEDAEKMFEETEEGIALFPKILTALNKFPEYNMTISVLDLIDENWRKYEGFCKRVIIDKLKEKENAPELINIFN